MEDFQFSYSPLHWVEREGTLKIKAEEDGIQEELYHIQESPGFIIGSTGYLVDNSQWIIIEKASNRRLYKANDLIKSKICADSIDETIKFIKEDETINTDEEFDDKIAELISSAPDIVIELLESGVIPKDPMFKNKSVH